MKATSYLLSLLLLSNAHAAFVVYPVQQNTVLSNYSPSTFGVATDRSTSALSFSNNNFHVATKMGQLFARELNLGMTSKDAEADADAQPYKIIISGAPASGKGTQCEMIKTNYGVVHLSTGDMLRAAVTEGTKVGKLAKEYMDSGKLVPDEVIIGVVSDRLAQSDCQESGWLLDGFPRTRAQADALAAAGVSADCFLFLNVPDSSLVERVVGRRTDPETGKIYHMTFSPPDDEKVLERLEQRSDDTEEKVKVRLEQFHDNVESVKGCYEDISIEVDGSTSVEEVAAKISDAIEGCRA